MHFFFVLCTFLFFKDTFEKFNVKQEHIIETCPLKLVQNSTSATECIVKKQFKRQNIDDIDEKHILALILKEDYDYTSGCKKKLKKYCEDLGNSSLTPQDIHKKLNDLCNNGTIDTKCTSVASDVEGICIKFQATLQTELQSLIYGNCTENERKCMLLEGACSTKLKDNCNALRNACYQKKRDDVAIEILLRALNDGSLKDPSNSNKCEEKLREVCLELIEESIELAVMCFHTEDTCKTLVNTTKKTCDTMEEQTSNAINSSFISNETCLLLLEQCYFHSSNCNDTVKDNCTKLEEKCKKQSTVFMSPVPFFDPTKPIVRLSEKIGLEVLYQKSAKNGIYIGKPHVLNEYELLALLNRNITEKQVKSTELEENCNKTLKENCKNIKNHPRFGYLCSNDEASINGTQKCSELYQEISSRSTRSTTLFVKLSGKKLYRGGNIVPWDDLPRFFSKEDCAKFESECFYLEPYDRINLEMPCKNLKAACYKRGFEFPVNERFEDKLRGKLHDLNEEKVKKLLKMLVDECKNLKVENSTNNKLFSFCLLPRESIELLVDDIEFRAIFLRRHLNERQDFPNEDCEKLEEECKELVQDLKEMRWQCYSLKHHCYRWKQMQALEMLLLEKNGVLENETNCQRETKKLCKKWSKTNKNNHSFVCVERTVACQIMTQSVKNKCKILEKNAQYLNITATITTSNMDKKEELCELWEPYCNLFMSHCNDLVNNKSSNEECGKIKQACKNYRQRRDLENQIMIKLLGNLENETTCNTSLNTYCTMFGTIDGLKELCNENNTGGYNSSLCKRLVYRVRKKCLELSVKLEEEKDELDKQSNEYEMLKKEAEKTIENAEFVLALSETVESILPNKSMDSLVTSNELTNNSTEDLSVNRTRSKLIKRDSIKIHTLLQEALAFEKTNDVFDFYLDLQEKCKQLQNDCLFKKECKKSNDICEHIENICHKIKPLEVKKQTVKTVIKNVTETKSTTVTKNVTETKSIIVTKNVTIMTITAHETGVITQGTSCILIRTMDTWVTHTSIYTNTLTMTLTSTQKCKPTKCTTEGEGDEEGHVKPSGGAKISGGSVMKSVVLTILVWMLI